MRLFVAAWPDDETRRRLSGLELELGRSKGLRFVGTARWHVTLRFLGEVGEDTVGPLGDALTSHAAKCRGPAECRLGPGTGWFTGVRVLYLPAAGLDGLAAVVHAATVPLVPEPRTPSRTSTGISPWPAPKDAASASPPSARWPGSRSRRPFRCPPSTWCRRSRPPRATSTRRWCGRRSAGASASPPVLASAYESAFTVTPDSMSSMPSGTCLTAPRAQQFRPRNEGRLV